MRATVPEPSVHSPFIHPSILMRVLGRHIAEVESGPEGALAAADETDLRVREIRLRGPCWTHAGRAVLGVLPLAILALPGARPGAVLLIWAPLGVHVVLEVYRAAKAFQALRDTRGTSPPSLEVEGP